MKAIYKVVSYFFTAVLLLGGCAKNDDFSTPSIGCNEPDLKVNMTIDQLYDVLPESKNVVLYQGANQILSGIVISSDEGGNFYQQLYLVDEQTQKPLILKVDQKGGYSVYPVGTKVLVKLDGTYMQNSYGMITIGGGIYTSSSGTKYPDAITGTKLRTILYRSCTKLSGDNFAKYNTSVSITELKADKALLGRLITVEKVQFVDAVIGKTYYESKSIDNDSQGYTLRKMEDMDGNTLVVRTGKYSNGFKDEIISDKSGSITGIVSDFQGTLQFYPRTMLDMKLDQERFNTDTTVDPISKKEGENIVGVDQHNPGVVADFEHWSSFIAATNSYGLLLEAKEAPNKGKNGQAAMTIQGDPASNDYLFVTENQSVVSKATSISFYIKGTSSKSLSFNVYKSDGSYDVFNLATDDQIAQSAKPIYSSDLVLYPTHNMSSTNAKNGNNDYATGRINAKDWIKVTLNLEGIDYNTSGRGKVFGFKVGEKGQYDLLVSNIVYEWNDSVDPVDPIIPVPSDLVADFTNWNEFVSLTDKGSIKYGTQAIGQGRNGKDAMKVDSTLKKGDYLFKVKGKSLSSDKTKMVVWVKGKATKSLSFNVYTEKDPTKYKVFNGKEISKSKELVVASGNSYTGEIDTNEQWVKLTLDLTTMQEPYNSVNGSDILAVKLGDGSYDILIDSIYLE